MTQKNGKTTEKLLIFGIILLTISIQLATTWGKTWFVEETGNIGILGGPIGILLSFGLLWKWRYARELLLFFSLLALIMTVVITITSFPDRTIAYLILLLAIAALNFLLFTLKSEVITHVNNE